MPNPSSDFPKRDARSFQATLAPYRSLSPAGFATLMTAVGAVGFMSGIAFLLLGAWPVMFFFGLDVLLIYVAFRMSYRSGRLYETIDLTPEHLTLARFHPSGRGEQFEFNPTWVRVLLTEGRDGRTHLALASHGRSVGFGAFLTDDERRDFASVLKEAIVLARGGPRI